MRSRVVLTPLVAAAILLAGCTALAPGSMDADPGPAEHEVTHHSVASFDDTLIAISVFRPAGSSETQPVPIVLRSHGWSGSRDTEIGGIVEKFLDAGLGVVTFDARGHGESEGVARVHDPDFEIRDVGVVIDWMHDNLEWALADGTSGIPKDLVLGGSGGSYGGGWQLLSAALDGRLDALAPEITWNSLPRALAPNEAIKSGWVHVLYSAGKARARLHPDIDAWYQEAAATNEFPEAARQHFAESSIYPYSDAITQPTLLVQGMPDTLFNYNEAADTFAALDARGVDVRLLTHLEGHLLAAGFFAGFVPGSENVPLPDPGFPQHGPAESPCGDVHAAIVGWLVHHLLDGPAPEAARVRIALDDGSCLDLDGLPTTTETRPADGPVALPAMVGSILVPLGEAKARTVIAGAPHLNASSVTVLGLDDILYASLVVVDGGGERRVLSSQVTPIRLGESPADGIALEMGGIGAVLDPGDGLFLKLDRVNEFFATNSGRVPGAIVLDGVSVSLPVIADA